MATVAGVIGGALPFSGPLDLASINAEWGLGTDLTLYHGVRWYYDGNLTTGLFGSSTIKVSDFYGKRATDPATSGTYFSNTVGSGSYTTSLYRNSITIEIWGGGGSGGGGNGGAGGKGGDSSVLNVTAGGGQGGQPGVIPVPPPPLDTSTNTSTGGHGGRDQSLNSVGYTNSLGGTTYSFTDSSGNHVGYVSTAEPGGYGPVVGQAGQTGQYGTSFSVGPTVP
jgi:hypothetical protein